MSMNFACWEKILSTTPDGQPNLKLVGSWCNNGTYCFSLTNLRARLSYGFGSPCARSVFQKASSELTFEEQTELNRLIDEWNSYRERYLAEPGDNVDTYFAFTPNYVRQILCWLDSELTPGSKDLELTVLHPSMFGTYEGHCKLTRTSRTIRFQRLDKFHYRDVNLKIKDYREMMDAVHVKAQNPFGMGPNAYILPAGGIMGSWWNPDTEELQEAQ